MTKTQVRKNIKNNFKYLVSGDIAETSSIIGGYHVTLTSHINSIEVSVSKDEILLSDEINKDESELETAVDKILGFVSKIDAQENNIDSELDNALNSEK